MSERDRQTDRDRDGQRNTDRQEGWGRIELVTFNYACVFRYVFVTLSIFQSQFRPDMTVMVDWS